MEGLSANNLECILLDPVKLMFDTPPVLSTNSTTRLQLSLCFPLAVFVLFREPCPLLRNNLNGTT